MIKLRNPIRLLLAKLPPMPSQPPTHEAEKSTLLLLACLILIAVLLHFQIANISIAIFASAIFALKTLIIIRRLPPPPRLVMISLTVASLLMVIYLYGGWSGQRTGISFIVLLITLKFLESHSLRDYYVVCLLLFFLAACSFLFDSSILNITIVIAYTLVIISVLFQLSNPAKKTLKTTLTTSSLMIVKALPLAIILFFFFPRIQGDFGFLPSFDRSNNTSALSDSLVAGEMAASAFNNELAFRVQFTGDATPKRSQLYWRAKTMPVERNFQWAILEPNASDFASARKTLQTPNDSSTEWRYEILHEKSKDKYLPYLDYISETSKGRILPDFSVYSHKRQANAFSYNGISTGSSEVFFAAPKNKAPLLQLASKPNPEIQRLIKQWRNGEPSDAEMVSRVYQYFENTPFEYSLLPASLDEGDPLGDFLLNTREGYCEHYASAFTILMRLLGIPSRVVVGYQGGNFVNNGEFIEVRYSDAHAWSEVWVNDAWQRVDPTASISPERINYGMDTLMALWDSNLLGSNNTGRALQDLLNPAGWSRTLKNLSDSWKNAGYQWDRWVVNYDFDTQRQLLEKLGIQHRNSVAALVAIMFLGALTLLLIYFWQLIPRRIKRHEEQTIYLTFIAKFKRFKIEKAIGETPQEFAYRASLLFPESTNEINRITQTYYSLRYGNTTDEPTENLIDLKAQIKKLKLKRKSTSTT